MIQRKSTNRILLDHAFAIAGAVRADALFLSADKIQAEEFPSPEGEYKLIHVTSTSLSGNIGKNGVILRVPNTPLTRNGQIKLGVLFALTEGLIQIGDRIVFVAGVTGGRELDTIMISQVTPELEMFSSLPAICPLPHGLRPEVFQRVVTLASEIGVEGREGRPVGTLFVVGDTDQVLSHCKQLILNPFQGYEEKKRNILDDSIKETVKEFAAIDGAFVVRGDGTIVTCGTNVEASLLKIDLPHGLGARHSAAANITAVTSSVAIAVSQSTGTVTLFRSGEVVTEIEKGRMLTLSTAPIIEP